MIDLCLANQPVLHVDVPDLPAAALEDAVRRLAADPHAVVTGPSGDGSFYLLGLTVHNHVVPELFDKARWGTPHMLEDVEAAAVAHGLTVGRTMDWHDVDTPEDVRELADRVRSAPTTAKATAEMLRELKLIP